MSWLRCATTVAVLPPAHDRDDTLTYGVVALLVVRTKFDDVTTRLAASAGNKVDAVGAVTSTDKVTDPPPQFPALHKMPAEIAVDRALIVSKPTIVNVALLASVRAVAVSADCDVSELKTVSGKSKQLLVSPPPRLLRTPPQLIPVAARVLTTNLTSALAPPIRATVPPKQTEILIVSPVLSVVALEAIKVVLTAVIVDTDAWAGATGNNAKNKPAIRTDNLRFTTPPIRSKLP